MFAKLKFESGVHRVQRVPVTESGGRIHTSAATVAVLPEPDEVDVQIDDKDLKIDIYRASGAGGQHVNTTDSAVRITHLPTGHRGDPAGRAQPAQEQGQGDAGAAHAALREDARTRRRAPRPRRARRWSGSGDRSERIRTYNFPQGRVTDHRINLTLHRLPEILEGPGLAELIDALDRRGPGQAPRRDGRVTGAKGHIHVGVGGWTYEPWRGRFYPPGLPHAKELAYAGQQLTGIEINATFYSLQKPASYAKWRDAVPEGFVFTLKGSRYCTNRKVLGEAGEAIGKFLGQGIVELGAKLGPINWQLAHTKRFEPDDIAAFFALLPREHAGVRLRHAIEPRHESFRDPAFFALARQANVAVVGADADKFPAFDEQTADFDYLRLQRTRADIETGYPPDELEIWAQRVERWSAGGRDVFVFFIAGAKERAPDSAQAFLARLNA